MTNIGDPFGLAESAAGLKEGEIDEETLLMEAPGLIYFLEASALILTGQLSRHEEGIINLFMEGLLPILIHAHEGDEKAQTQLAAIEKIIFPETYDLPHSAIEEFVEKHHKQPSLARGWAVRHMMGQLSWGVRPAQQGVESVLKGRVKLNPNGLDKEIVEIVRKAFERMGKSSATLQSLAINVLQETDPSFSNMDEQQIMRDMRRVEEWDASLPDCLKPNTGDKTMPSEDMPTVTWVVVVGGKKTEHLLVGPYSEGWKHRKPGSGGIRKKKAKKLDF